MSGVNLALTSQHMHGEVVEQCQRDMNTRLKAWGALSRVNVDGDWGMASRDTAQSLLYGLGVDVGGDYDGVSSADRIKIRHGASRLTKAEHARYVDRKTWRGRYVDRVDGGAAGAIARAVEYARSHLGVTEHPAGSNTGPQIDKWEAACEVHAAPWCGCFVNACLHAAGFPNLVWLRFCPSIEAKAKAGEGGWSWHSTAKVGDLVLYGSSVAEHVGLVERVGDGRDTATIEGNTSTGPGGSQSNGGIVARRHRHEDGSLAGFPIRGYARPSWGNA